MAFSYQVDVSDAAVKAPAEMEARIRALQGRRFNQQVARAGANLLQAKYDGLQRSRPNKQGWPRQNFWAKAARSVNSSADDNEAVFGASALGIRQRLEGGVIRPRKAGGKLTVPARAEAYGKRAGEFGGKLKMVFARRGGRVQAIGLAEVDVSDVRFRKGKDGSLRLLRGGTRGGLMMFWLVDEVNQKADPSVGLTAAEIRQVVEDTANAAWARREGGVS